MAPAGLPSLCVSLSPNRQCGLARSSTPPHHCPWGGIINHPLADFEHRAQLHLCDMCMLCMCMYFTCTCTCTCISCRGLVVLAACVLNVQASRIFLVEDRGEIRALPRARVNTCSGPAWCCPQFHDCAAVISPLSSLSQSSAHGGPHIPTIFLREARPRRERHWYFGITPGTETQRERER